jgi:K+-sensing histidine kinase KdpD
MKGRTTAKKLFRTRSIMTMSYVLLMVFSLLWIKSQYREQEHDLQKQLAQIFESVQQDITDSLIFVTIIDPTWQVEAAPPLFEMKEGKVVTLNEDSIKQLSGILLSNSTQDISRQTIRMAVRKVRNLSLSERQMLFQIDTTIFNSTYANRLKQMGWNFGVKWVAADEKKPEGAFIYIPNNFLHSGFGVMITNYDGYILANLWLQGAFIIILLTAILLAFVTTYRSLLRQIQLSELKDDFVSNISHELKTPIATVKVAIEAVQHFEAAGEHSLTAEYMEMAALEIERLELLVNRSLHTSLLESGKIALQRERHSLKTIIEDVIQAYQVKLLAYEATVNFTTEGLNFETSIDKLHFQGVLINLIDNSLKYCPHKPYIHIHLKELSGSLMISLTDNGPGIPEQYQHKVFEKFFRVPNGNEHNVKGYGLGLCYASQVMTQHNGSISVCNVPEGGCSFTLSLQ